MCVFLHTQLCVSTNVCFAIVASRQRNNSVRVPETESALSLPITNMKLPAREHIPCVSKFCFDEWQDIWDCCEGNKLHYIYPTVGIVKHSKNISRYDSVLLNRLRIGHSRLTHSYLLSGDDSPTCQSCGIPLTVKHILVECANLRDIREKYFTVLQTYLTELTIIL